MAFVLVDAFNRDHFVIALMTSEIESAFSFPKAVHNHLVSYARTYIQSVLEKGVKRGQVEIVDSSGSYTYGESKEGKSLATIRILDDVMWLRVFMFNDLGFAESFMLGEIEVDNLARVCGIWVDNASRLGELSTLFHHMFASWFKLTSTLMGQEVSRAKLNTIAGYDASNILFKAFLSDEMMYSCALWGAEEGGIHGDLDGVAKLYDLEDAQMRKIHHVLKKAHVKPGDRILEFGSGWCALAIEAARSFGCTVDTITLSIEQKKLGEERVRAAGLSSFIRVHLLDYRELPPTFEKAFDAFISIEMIEHVGPRHYETFFRIVDWALKSCNAVAVISSTTMPEARYAKYQAPDFSRYYMWPNSSLPSATALITAAKAGSNGRMGLESVENHGQHYPRTLREWARRFDTNVTKDVTRDIIRERPELASVIEPFKRKWVYLFPSAEAGFASGYLACHMLTFVRDMTILQQGIGYHLWTGTA